MSLDRRFNASIRTKIFGLAITLLVLTIALAVFLLYQVVQAEKDLNVVASLDPLTNSISLINEFGLRRRLAFEREYGALNARQPNLKTISDASANYARYTPRLAAEVAHAHALIAAYPKELANRPDLVEIETLLDQTQQGHKIIAEYEEEALASLRTNQYDKGDQNIDLLDDLQRSVQTQRETMQAKMTALIGESVRASRHRQRMVLWLSLAATLSTIFLGLSVATWIVDRITQPVRSLMLAMRDVQGGNLKIRLSVDSADEVGALTESFNFFVEELQAKERIKSTFGKYIDPRIIEQVLSQSAASQLAGARCVMTVLFADLVGFTSLSERLTPSLIVTVLNRHFSLQAEAVHEHHGVVDKYIGDSVMAFWGPPFVQTKDTEQLACQSAQAQIKALLSLRAELAELTGLRRDTPAIDLRIGICTGEVIVGNIGSDKTRSYTVIGDTVNLASRLEAVNRIYGTRVMIDQRTAQALGSNFETREIDMLSVKGKVESTRVFELLDTTGSTGEDRQFRDRFKFALDAYRKGDWDHAETAFRECKEMQPEDGPSTLFLSRIEILRQKPPAKDWDGTWRLETK